MNLLTSTGPLRGRTILDCSALLPGPFVGKLLVSLGARVIKIESPERPDPAREMPSFYADLNEDKELVIVSLLDPSQRPRFESLVREADGLIEGFRPAAKRKLGLDESTLHAINPRLCIASIIGYPETGPDAARAGHDLNFEALTGTLSLFREMPGLPLADLFGAYQCALSMASALDQAARTGRGVRMVTSMHLALLEAQSMVVRRFHDTGEEPQPGTTLFSGLHPCYRLYDTADGRKMAVGALEPKFWVKVCEVLGLPELKEDGTSEGPRAHEVGEQVAKVFRSRTQPEWISAFSGIDCCVDPVLTYSEAHPHGL